MPTVKKIAWKTLTITGKILMAVFGVLEEMESARHHFGNERAFENEGVRGYLAESRRTHRYAFARLRKRGYIADRKIGARVVTKLTTDGTIAALELAVAHTVKKLPNGQRCLIAYDIPVAAHKTRMVFRYALRKMGFTYLQHSLWRTDRDVIHLMERYVTLLDIKRWVKVFVCSETA